jgi:beta-glucosidase
MGTIATRAPRQRIETASSELAPKGAAKIAAPRTREAAPSKEAMKAIGVARVDPVEAKIDALISKMTLEEKVEQMSQVGWIGNATGPEQVAFNGSREERVKKGLGSLLNVHDPKDVRRLQKIALEESRLKIPVLFGGDVITGDRTMGPQPTTLAASFDPEVVRSVCEVAGKEARARGTPWTFAPMLDVSFDPRWGRIVEAFGGDPYLVAQMGVASIRGFHDGGAATTMKHFAGYGMADGGVDYGAVHVSRQRLFDEILPPFKAAVEAGVDAVMPAFNSLNGTPSHANKDLTKILRKDWRFDGVSISDWTGLHELIAHGVASDRAEAATLGAGATIDMDMASDVYAENLAKMVKAGAVSEKTVDAAVRRILRLKHKLGLFEQASPELGAYEKMILSPEHLGVVRRAAERSIALLKNDSTSNGTPVLPIAASAKKIAVVGPIADSGLAHLGHWRGTSRPEEVVTAYQGIKQRAGDGCQVVHERGSRVSKADEKLLASALEASKDADVIVAVIGEEGEMTGEAASRPDPSLPKAQEALIEALASTGKPVVAVVMSGRPLTGLGSVAGKVSALLYAGQPGTMGGAALANLLFGSDQDGNLVSPGAKLSQPLLAETGDIGSAHHMRHMVGRPADVAGADGKYTWGPAVFDDDGRLLPGHKKHVHHQPLFAFGEGLTYTTFSQGEVEVPAKVSRRKLQDEGLVVKMTVTNTGEREADQVVQVYARDVLASQVQPMKKLVAFERVTLKPKETKTVTLRIRAEDLAYYNEAKKKKVIEPGQFKLWIGTSAKDEDAKVATFEVLPESRSSGRSWEVRS